MTTIPGVFLGDVSDDVHIDDSSWRINSVSFRQRLPCFFFLGGWHCMQAKALVGMKGDAGPQKIGDVHNSRAFDETID